MKSNVEGWKWKDKSNQEKYKKKTNNNQNNEEQIWYKNQTPRDEIKKKSNLIQLKEWGWKKTKTINVKKKLQVNPDTPT